MNEAARNSEFSHRCTQVLGLEMSAAKSLFLMRTSVLKRSIIWGSWTCFMRDRPVEVEFQNPFCYWDSIGERFRCMVSSS